MKANQADFSSYVSALKFLAPKFCMKNARVKHWWNWQQQYETKLAIVNDVTLLSFCIKFIQKHYFSIQRIAYQELFHFKLSIRSSHRRYINKNRVCYRYLGSWEGVKPKISCFLLHMSCHLVVSFGITHILCSKLPRLGH